MRSYVRVLHTATAAVRWCEPRTMYMCLPVYTASGNSGCAATQPTCVHPHKHPRAAVQAVGGGSLGQLGYNPIC